jgi:hypothetical protein
VVAHAGVYSIAAAAFPAPLLAGRATYLAMGMDVERLEHFAVIYHILCYSVVVFIDDIGNF